MDYKNAIDNLWNDCDKGLIENHLIYAQKEHELLELYQKAIDLMICVPQNETYHYVVRYTDDVKFNSILNQITNKMEALS